MTDSPPTIITVQALPEIRWEWRRAFAFLIVLLCAAGIGLIIVKCADPTTLRWVGLALCGLIALVTAFYIGGATMTDLARLAEAVTTKRLINETRPTQPGATGGAPK
ncbi:MAG: hypothetical protein ACXW3D_01290 [Caulobacteraceae bacterium]